jgi:hypothetical protein
VADKLTRRCAEMKENVLEDVHDNREMRAIKFGYVLVRLVSTRRPTEPHLSFQYQVRSDSVVRGLYRRRWRRIPTVVVKRARYSPAGFIIAIDIQVRLKRTWTPKAEGRRAKGSAKQTAELCSRPTLDHEHKACRQRGLWRLLLPIVLVS